MEKKYGPLAVLIIILLVAIAWNAYFQSAPPRILPKYFGIEQGSLVSMVILVILIIIVLGIAYTVTRRKH